MAVAATGFFDGVHIGHRQVIAHLCSMASSCGQKSLVVTFWPHPRTVLQQDADSLRLLTSLEEKKRLLLDCGVDEVAVIPFTRDFSRLSAREFLTSYLRYRYEVTSLVLGYDHRLGHDLIEDPAEMESIVRSCGIEPLRVSKFGEVSSTAIRRALFAGDVQKASSLLGYRYSLKGVVVSSGQKLGRSLGYPTANIQLYEPLKLIPSDGVYAVWVYTLGRRLKGVCNIGTGPTMKAGSGRNVSTYIFALDEDIYGLDITVEFVARLRDECAFASQEELRLQMGVDCLKASDLLEL